MKKGGGNDGYVDAYAKAHRRFGKTPAPEDMSPEWLEARELWNDRSAKASSVLDLLSLDDFRKERNLSLPIPIDLWIDLLDDWKKAVDDSIAKNLNSQTLPILIQLVQDSPKAVVVQELVKSRFVEYARKAGLASGESRKTEVKCTPAQVVREYQTMMATGTEERNVAGKLAKRFNVTADHVRNLRKKGTKK